MHKSLLHSRMIVICDKLSQDLDSFVGLAAYYSILSVFLEFFVVVGYFVSFIMSSCLFNLHCLLFTTSF